MLRRYLRSIYEMISSVTTKRAADQQHVKKVELDGPPAAKVQRKPKITTYAMLLAYEGRNYFGMQVYFKIHVDKTYFILFAWRVKNYNNLDKLMIHHTNFAISSH
jgi:hypothetical protein